MLRLELDSARAAISRKEGVNREFTKKMYTDYTSLMRALASNYCDRLNAVLFDTQIRGEYLGGYEVCVAEDGNSRHPGNVNSDNERGGCKFF